VKGLGQHRQGTKSGGKFLQKQRQWIPLPQIFHPHASLLSFSCIIAKILVYPSAATKSKPVSVVIAVTPILRFSPPLDSGAEGRKIRGAEDVQAFDKKVELDLEPRELLILRSGNIGGRGSRKCFMVVSIFVEYLLENIGCRCRIRI
jgi:hypothetical protein